MKKNLLVILVPLIFTIACALAVSANEPGAAQPACDKCPKVDAKMQAAEGKPCLDDNCPKMKAAQAKPGDDKGCDKCPKMQPVARKPCCDEGKPE